MKIKQIRDARDTEIVAFQVRVTKRVNDGLERQARTLKMPKNRLIQLILEQVLSPDSDFVLKV